MLQPEFEPRPEVNFEDNFLVQSTMQEKNYNWSIFYPQVTMLKSVHFKMSFWFLLFFQKNERKQIEV